MMDAPSPTVSVVIPAYNREASIRTAIESVLRQTWPDFELIVVDDCYTDSTVAQVARIDDPRLRLVQRTENGGAAAARNTGITEAKGTWIAFQDSDDEWLPTKLEKQMTRLCAPGSDFIAAYCGMLIWGEAGDGEAMWQGRSNTGRRTEISYQPDLARPAVEGSLQPALLAGNFISTQTLVARRDVLMGMDGFDTDLPSVEDWDCAVRLAGQGRIACIDEPLVIQRFSPNSLSRQIERRLTARDVILQKHEALYAQRPDLLARLHRGQARGWSRLNRPEAAQASLARAKALKPFNLKGWVMQVHLALRSTRKASK
jgi:glycosyltransferase involved in cell wall biosynthesis